MKNRKVYARDDISLIDKIRYYIWKFLDNITKAIMFVVVMVSIVVVASVVKDKIDGKDPYAFGYKPIYVMTGSMEPYMKTNGTVIVKRVNSMDEIAVGDVINYHINTTDNKVLHITHRITDIASDGTITTKGDNNKQADAYALTLDNIDAKVVSVQNWTSDLYDEWQTTAGKFFIICLFGFIIAVYMFLKAIIYPQELIEGVSDKDKKRKRKNSDNVEVAANSNAVTWLTNRLDEDGYDMEDLVFAISKGYVDLSGIEKVNEDAERIKQLEAFKEYSKMLEIAADDELLEDEDNDEAVEVTEAENIEEIPKTKDETDEIVEDKLDDTDE